jgi:hypothetical protein
MVLEVSRFIQNSYLKLVNSACFDFQMTVKTGASRMNKHSRHLWWSTEDRPTSGLWIVKLTTLLINQGNPSFCVCPYSDSESRFMLAPLQQSPRSRSPPLLPYRRHSSTLLLLPWCLSFRQPRAFRRCGG